MADTGRVTIRNWANVYSATPEHYHEPETIEQVAAIVSDAALATKQEGALRPVIRVVGSGHSPNDCAMSDSVMISLKKLRKVHWIDMTKAQIRVDAGITLEELNEVLDKNGLAMPVLGSISEQSIAGAIATGTHGTGATLGSLSETVKSLTIVDGQGNVITASPEDPATADLFYAALVSFGALGVVVALTLQVVPAFDLQTVENEVSLPEVLSTIEKRCFSAKHYRFWWFPHSNMCTEWRGDPVEPVVHREEAAARGYVRQLYRTRVQPLVDWFWGMLIGFHLLQLALWLALYFPSLVPHINELWRKMLFSPAFSHFSFVQSFLAPRRLTGEAAGSAAAAAAAEPAGVYKRRTDRSDRCFNFNCLFQQHVDEWAIPAQHLPQALVALRQVIDGLGQKAHFPVEVRFVAEDKAWLSPCHGRALTCYIGIIAYKPYGTESEYRRYFHAFEREMLKWGGRPHWAKDFHLKGDADFAPLYPKWQQFKAMRDKMDPLQLFVNPFLRRVLEGEGQGQGQGSSAPQSPERKDEAALRRRNALLGSS